MYHKLIKLDKHDLVIVDQLPASLSQSTLFLQNIMKKNLRQFNDKFLGSPQQFKLHEEARSGG